MPHHRVHIIELSPEIQSATISGEISTLRVDAGNRAVKSRAMKRQKDRERERKREREREKVGIIRFASTKNEFVPRSHGIYLI